MPPPIEGMNQQGMPPMPEDDNEPLHPTKPGKMERAGGILSTLLGWKHRENMRKEMNTAKFIMDELHDAATNPNNMLPPETVDFLVKQAGGVLGKEAGTAIKQHFEQIRAKKDLERRQGMLPQQNATPGSGMSGAAVMKAGAQAPVIPASPVAGASPVMGGAAGVAAPPGLPKPPGQLPFDQGAPAGGAPQQPNPVAMMVEGAAKGGTGFGGPVASPPPAASGGSFFRKSPAQIGIDTAAMERPALEGKAQVVREGIPLDFAARKQAYGSEPGIEDLTSRQKFGLYSGHNITAEPRPVTLPGAVRGADIIGQTDAFGKVVGPDDARSTYKVRDYNGVREFFPEFGMSTHRIMPDKDSPTGFSDITYNRDGNEIHRELGAVDPRFAPSTTSSTGQSEQAVTIGDQVVKVPISRSNQTTTVKTVPGMPPIPGGVPQQGAPVAAPVAAPGGAPAPKQQPPRSPGMRVIGESPAAWKMRMENEYTPEGQKVMQELFPRKEMIGRLRDALKPYMNSDTPASYLLDSIMYKMGFAGDQGAFLSQLNLGSLAQAATLVKGSSRAQNVLNKAMIHTPDAWTNSPKLMYEKLTEILKNMQDMEKGVDTYMKKYPGLGKLPASGKENDPLGIR